QEVPAGIDLGGLGVFNEHPQVGLQQSRRILGPFHVTADPEHRLGDPAQQSQIPRPACCCFSSCCRWVSASFGITAMGTVATVSGTSGCDRPLSTTSSCCSIAAPPDDGRCA